MNEQRKPTLLRYNYTIDTLRRQPFYKHFTPQQKFTHILHIRDAFDKECDLVLGEKEMPKKRTGDKPEWAVNFARINLSSDEKKQAKEWIKNNINDCDMYWVNLGTDGWKQSSSYDSENDCWIVSLTQRQPDHRDYNVCVTSRAANPIEGLMLCFFKIVVLYDGVKLPVEGNLDNWG